MSGEDFVGVTLANVDPSIVSCWDKMVKQGEECSLLLKHSKGKVVATLQCTTPVKTSTSLPSSSPSALEKKKKKKRKGACKEVGKAPGLPPTLGGGERTSAQQADGGARCSLHPSSCQELQWKQV